MARKAKKMKKAFPPYALKALTGPQRPLIALSP
jgi:hypothetical protein